MFRPSYHTGVFSRGIYHGPVALSRISRSVKINPNPYNINPKTFIGVSSLPQNAHVMHIKRGSGIFDSINKYRNIISNAAQSVWGGIKEMTPKIGEYIPKVGTYISNIWDAINKRDMSKIGSISDDGQKLFKEGRDIYKTGRDKILSIGEMIKRDKEKLREVNENKVAQAEKNEMQKKQDEMKFREAQNAIQRMAINKPVMEKLGIPIGGETVVSDDNIASKGSGFIRNILRKQGRKVISGKGFKKF